MTSSDPTSFDKLRQQFDNAPYPNVPLEWFPDREYNLLFVHNLVTPYYLKHHRAIDTTNKVMLDAGCGAGYKALALAIANPGAHVVGVDLSEKSVELARQRLQHYNLDDCEFHALLIEDLPKLGLKFDYINCDEVLYLLPDPLAGLQAMRSVLNPEGILRINLHSSFQRSPFYRAQALFGMMGLLDQNPKDMAVELVIETMEALRDTTNLKRTAWKSEWTQPENQGQILANLLLDGDKGYTIPDLFALLEAADLEFLSMVNWRHWEITDLFKEPENLPAFWGVSLEGASLPEKLHLYDLLDPTSRLLDCWCTLPQSTSIARSIDQWSEADWQIATVHLHPQLRHPDVKSHLLTCIAQNQLFELNRYFDLPTLGTVAIESTLAACLLPLWEAPQPVAALVDRYLRVRSIHPATLAPTTSAEAFQIVKALLSRLETFLYLLLETPEE